MLALLALLLVACNDSDDTAKPVETEPAPVLARYEYPAGTAPELCTDGLYQVRGLVPERGWYDLTVSCPLVDGCLSCSDLETYPLVVLVVE